MSESSDAGGRDSFAFVDGPRLELDELLAQLIGRAEDVMSAQGRLRGLLIANRMIISELDLPAVLRHIVEAACTLVKAKYGALGVIAAAGGLQEFVYVGIDDVLAHEIGPLPAGKGLLGAVIEDAGPIRLKTMTDDIRSVGFPPNHPPMSSFLGVPIRVRDTAFGNLYLTEAAAGEFTVEDEDLVTALAATAGIAIENARLFAQAEQRQSWMHASMQITRQLLSTTGDDPLTMIAQQAREIADADIVTIVVPTAAGDQLMVEVASGERADEFIGMTYPAANSLAERAFTSGEPMLVSEAGVDPQYTMHLSALLKVGPVMVLPFVGAQRVRGALVIGRLHGKHSFDESDLEMATTFANHAAIALELADARVDQQRVVLLEDRDRIARDLHDHVIQRLFAAGLTMQSIATGLPGALGERLGEVVAEVDDTIRQIRSSIFQLRGRIGPSVGTTRSTVASVVADLSPVLGFDPHICFDGPIDSVVPEAMVDDVDAVVREGLMNVARHAQAQRAEVRLSASEAELALDVIDDGVGMAGTQRRSGLANLRARAEQFNGTLTLADAPGDVASAGRRGTWLRWTIPLS